MRFSYIFNQDEFKMLLALAGYKKLYGYSLENKIISAFAFVPMNSFSDSGKLISTSKSPSADAVGEILVRVPSKTSVLASVVTFTFCQTDILVIS